ncbi:MAG: hypothetical protein ACOZQL_40490 [Myxococcota bacterium]
MTRSSDAQLTCTAPAGVGTALTVASQRSNLRVVELRTLESVHPADLIELEPPTVLTAQPLAPPPSAVIASPPRLEPTLDAVFAPLLAALKGGPPAATSVTVSYPGPSITAETPTRKWEETTHPTRCAPAAG